MAVQHELKLFAGPGNPALAQAVADWLDVPLGKMLYSQFADGENYVRFEESVRGTDAYILQPTCPPVDTNLVVLLEAIDALRRASAWRITPVIPYYGYARQEKKDKPREPITAKLIADIITVAGANRVMCLDLHADAIQGFFNIPVDHLTALNLFVDYFEQKMQDGLQNVVVVSPDEGRVKKVRKVVVALKAPLAVGYKHHPSHMVSEVTHLAGDVRGKTPIIVEDMITTGGSILQAVDALLEHGCNPQIHIAATHGVFARDALERLCSRPEIAELVVTDSIPLPQAQRHPKITVLSVASLFGEAIHRANSDLSITSLFD
ncbi:MAG TPA: ribose-phosphate pyrophosphokinase [Chthonomonadaceae bacterium]|nr:ribose-phosphate pyrophosphokinase [Chthonomonadaceae bacterium]